MNLGEQNSQWNYPENLPIVTKRHEIITAIQRHGVIVVISETGSGKTTQLPKMVAEALGYDGNGLVEKMIGVTQPRRIAAVSVAKRVADELKEQLGNFVGYQVRFDNKISQDTRIKFMTDGILLAETQNDPLLKKYDAIILDEAHERSLNIDFLLGYIKRLREQRPELKIVISSATLDAGAFSEFFSNNDEIAPIIEAEGRTYGVDEFFLPPNEGEELANHIVRATEWLTECDPEGDILVFLPGENEIRESTNLLESYRFPATEILPLFARLSISEQQKIFTPGKLRRIILATNVAETSLTIPRITSVIDSGLARVSRWNPTRGVQRLMIEPISQASARQRKGRCGRIKQGVCIRLYDEENLLGRNEFNDPEIRRSSLAGVILRMISLGLPKIEKFPLIDPPSPKAVTEGYRTLREVGALTKDHQLTRAGLEMAKMPLDPRLARILLEAKKENCLTEILPIIAGLECNDVRERPAEKQSQADSAHARWKHPQSDFISLLKLWLNLQEFRIQKKWQMNQLRKFCNAHFFNLRRVIEWTNIFEELRELLIKELRWQTNDQTVYNDSNQDIWQGAYDQIHRSLLAGIPRQFALWDTEEKIYRNANGGHFSIFPGSTLFAVKKIEWVMGMELVETSRLWARKVAQINPAWLEQVAPHLCRSNYSEGHWDQQQGAVYAKESVICGGLTIIQARRIHLGKVNPEGARKIFILDGLMKNAITGKCPCLEKLAELHEVVTLMEIKIRKPDTIWSEEKVFDFFDSAIPIEICTTKSFHDWRMIHEAVITPTLEDVIWDKSMLVDSRDFPDSIQHHEQEYPIYYSLNLGQKDDGISIGVHIDQLENFPEFLLEWGIEGNLYERVDFVVRSLPKDLRKACMPINDFVDEFITFHQDNHHVYSLKKALLNKIQEQVNYTIPESSIDLNNLPAEWIVKLWVCNDEGSELALGTNISLIREKLAPLTKQRLEQYANQEWEHSGYTTWPLPVIPESVESIGGLAFPALVDEITSVGVKAFQCKEIAFHSHRAGCARLLNLLQNDQASYVLKNYPIGLATKVELPRIGLGGTTMNDVILLTAEGVLENLIIRDSDFFIMKAKIARGNWYQSGFKIGNSLDFIITTLPTIRSWIREHLDSKYLAAIADDLSEQLSWLLREQFLWRAGYDRFSQYDRYLRSILSRIDRISSMPLTKDLEKMNRVRQLWEPWFEAWIKKPDNPIFWELGWMIEEYRISLFSPDIPTIGSISEKKIKSLSEKILY
jgi:ATP-dependent helicase HrpA